MSSPTYFLSGDSKTENFIRSFDWNGTSLGQLEQWPDLLKSALYIIFQAKQPMSICWGQERIHFFNEAFLNIVGSEQLLYSMGKPLSENSVSEWTAFNIRMNAVIQGKNFSSVAPLEQTFPDSEKACDRTWRCNISPVITNDAHRYIVGALATWWEVTDEKYFFNEWQRTDARLSSELRYRAETERLQDFKMSFADALRNRRDAKGRAQVALEMSGMFIHADHAYFLQTIEPHAAGQIFHEWHRVDGGVNITSTCVTVDFGPVVMAKLSESISVAIDCVSTDPRTEPFLANHVALHGNALLVSPVLRNNMLVAIFVLSFEGLHAWSENEISTFEEIADRTYNAITYAQENAKLLEVEQILSNERTNAYARLQSLFKHAPGFMCIMRGPKHVFEFVNESYSKMIGHREVVGLEAREALDNLIEKDLVDLLDVVYESGQPFTGADMPVTLLRSPDTQKVTIYVDVVLQPISGCDGAISGIFVEGFDVTERTLSKKALEVSQQRLRDGMAAAKMVIWDWDLISDEIIFCGAQNLFFDQNHCAASDIWNCIDPEDVDRLHAARAGAFDGQDTYREVVRLRSDGKKSPVWVQIQGQVEHDWQGRPIAIRGVSLDVTAQKQAEQALLEESRRKDQFLAMLAHELRNPLAPIAAAAEIIGRSSSTEGSLIRASSIVKRQVDHMTALVNDMLDVSRVTTGHVTLSKQAVCLNEIMLDSIEQVRPLMDANGLKLEFSPLIATDIVDGDRERLVQIFTNLLQNSAKFTPIGKKITISMRDLGEHIAVIVKDEGIGIEPALLKHVFELFVQGKSKVDRLHGGLGLGLALVKSLIELHDGTITAHSDGPNEGAEFTAILPRSQKASLEVAHPDTAVKPVGKRGKRVLIVDDNEDGVDLLALLLQDDGYDVVTTVDPLHALELAQTNPPDIFILDIGLPGMDGNELVKRLRKMPATAGVPIIALTGYGQASDCATAKSAGFDQFLVKPTKIEKLLQAISDIPENRTY